MKGSLNMKYAGVVVTYNRKDELVKNIEMILQQRSAVEMYYIVDNCSTDGTKEQLNKRGFLSPNNKIKYIRLKENIGGAGGFYIGVKAAFEDGFDCICMMDDDGRPWNDDTFYYLFNAAEKLYKTNKKLMLNSLVICDKDADKLSFGLGKMTTRDEAVMNAKDELICGLINPFNGTLITKELVKEIGFPNKDFFIRGDEVDYQSRARKADALIATVVKSIYYHPTFELVPLKWKGQIVYVGTCPPWKAYYLVRNYIYRIKRDDGVVQALKEFIFQCYSTIKCNPNGKTYIHFLCKGLFDGMTGKLGMRVKPGQK